MRDPTGTEANICSDPMPPPFVVVRTRLERALARRDMAAVRAAAGDFPGIVTLADAIEVLLLMIELDDPAFEASAIRWITRFANECPGTTLAELHAALEALDALPAPDAHATLLALLKRHGID
jgi:CBS domain containing-hemolysin-like protein